MADKNAEGCGRARAERWRALSEQGGREFTTYAPTPEEARSRFQQACTAGVLPPLVMDPFVGWGEGIGVYPDDDRGNVTRSIEDHRDAPGRG